jgi:hypothetical protein
MRGLSKKEKLEFILEKYQIRFFCLRNFKEIKLTEAGVSRILKGIAKTSRNIIG